MTDPQLGGITEYLNGGRQTANISVITPSLATRLDLLSEAIQSVLSQSIKPRVHYIGVDFKLVGEAQNENKMLELIDTEFVAWIHDDDVWLENHLEEGLKIADDADLIFSDYFLEGRGDWHPGHFHDWNKFFETNWMPPSCAIIRTETFKKLGGWHEMTHPRDWVDMNTWQKFVTANARIKCTCQKTVRYRFHVNENHQNGSA